MEKESSGLGAGRLAMMALGTVIGGSFFLGSSVAIKAAGPAVILPFLAGGAMVYFILTALSEMTVADAETGSFRTFAARAFGRGTGFVVGWVYWSGMVLAMSSEAAAVSILAREWVPGISIAVLGSLIIIGITLFNLLGAEQLSRLESGLAAVKLLAVISFILIAVLLILGIFGGGGPVGLGEVAREPFFPGGVKSLAGSMLVVMFTYAGFEIIGLAAPEAKNPKETVPKAIRYTVFGLAGLYLLAVGALLPLVPTAQLSEEISPFVSVLKRSGIGWAGTVLSVVLITAILSTMLAAMFGLGRMMRSLAEEGLAPGWVRDRKEVPFRGILFSGLSMLLSLWFGLLFPKVYLFLISSGGFALLFTYGVILMTHLKFRRRNGCPPDGKCQMWGYPYTSVAVLLLLLVSMVSMPFVPGQASGLMAGCAMVFFYSFGYWVGQRVKRRRKNAAFKPEFSVEFSEDWMEPEEPEDKEP